MLERPMERPARNVISKLLEYTSRADGGGFGNTGARCNDAADACRDGT